MANMAITLLGLLACQTLSVLSYNVPVCTTTITAGQKGLKAERIAVKSVMSIEECVASLVAYPRGAFAANYRTVAGQARGNKCELIKTEPVRFVSVSYFSYITGQ